MIGSHKKLMEKADLQLSELTTDGGALVPGQAQRFIRTLINESVLLKMVRVAPMRQNKEELPKTRFTTNVLQPGQPGVALAVGERSKLALSKVELSTELLKAEVRLQREQLEDNIERSRFLNTVMELMKEQVSLDLESLVIKGDTASGATPLLRVLDGILKQSTSNATPVAGSTSTTTWNTMFKAMPVNFLRRKPTMKFLTSIDSETDYRLSFGQRETDRGDGRIEDDTPIRFRGIPILGIPEWPEDYGGANTTAPILTDPKNIVLGIQRNITMESDKDISSGELIIVMHMRVDVKFEEETATVKGTGVTV